VAARTGRVIVAAALGVGVGISGLVFYSFGLFIPVLETQFGWGRGAISSGLLVMMFTTSGAAQRILRFAYPRNQRLGQSRHHGINVGQSHPWPG